MIARALGARVIGVDLSAAARARAAELGAVAIDVAGDAHRHCRADRRRRPLDRRCTGLGGDGAGRGERSAPRRPTRSGRIDARRRRLSALAGNCSWPGVAGRRLARYVGGRLSGHAGDDYRRPARSTRSDRRTHSAREGGHRDDGHGQPGGHVPGSPSPSPTPDHPHHEVGRYEVQCSRIGPGASPSRLWRYRIFVQRRGSARLRLQELDDGTVPG